MLQFLLSLKDANEEDSHQQQIVLATLKACPDLVISYLNGLSCTFEPKLSSKWISNVEFILQVGTTVCTNTHTRVCVCVHVGACLRVCVCVCAGPHVYAGSHVYAHVFAWVC